MAKRFFNQRVNNSQRMVTQIVLIVVCIVGVIICFCLANYFNNRSNRNNATIEMRDLVSVEVNTNLPDKTVFFTELENVKEEDIDISLDKVDINKIGKYPVKIEIYGKKYESSVNVVDTQAPDLNLKELKINPSTSYKAQDFVSSCTDNSKEKCIIEFYDLATDQDGNKINYASYREDGTYQIQISATDESGNETILSTTLTIGTGSGSTYCKYGNQEYDSDTHILAVDVTQNGCALDLNLYQDSAVLESVTSIMDKESEKLQKEFSKLNVKGTRILDRHSQAILNKTGNGIVGYEIHMEVAISDGESQETVLSYYLNQNGERIFSINKYNLPSK